MNTARRRCTRYHSSAPPGKIADPRDQTVPHAARSEPCLYAGRGGSVPGDRTRSTAGLAIHRQGQPGGRGDQWHAPCWDWEISVRWPASRSWRARPFLFKRFADIDVFDIELDTRDPRGDHPHLPATGADVRGNQPGRHQGSRMLPDRGRLRRTMKIPVFHDDQHGTAIISGAALLNALETGRKAHRKRASGVQRGRCRRHLVCRALCPPGRAPGKHPDLRHQGRNLQRPHRGHERIQARFAVETERAHAHRRACGRRCVHRAFDRPTA